MARIRTIKPEFWTDTLMVQLDPLTRLLYIGLWTAADDFGALPDEPERLAMQVMPREPVEFVEQRIDMLVASGRLSRMLAENGETYLIIEKWFDHQRVDKPTKSRIIREGSRKLAIPAESRRRVAAKYKCEPGETSDASCYFCGQPGQVHWPRLHSGRPGAWVCFSGLEIDHFDPEFSGGSSDETNLILSCRGCNRARRDRSVFDFVNARLQPRPDLQSQAHEQFERNIREFSRGLPDGREGKGEDRKGLETNPDSAAPSGRVLAEKPEVVIRSEIMAIVGDDMPPGDMNRPAMWIAQGYPLDLIRAVVVERFRAGKRPSSLAWFDKALAEAAAVKAPKPASSGPDDNAWRSVMRRWVEEGVWHPAFGPPGGSDCPAHIKAEFERAA